MNNFIACVLLAASFQVDPDTLVGQYTLDREAGDDPAEVAEQFDARVKIALFAVRGIHTPQKPGDQQRRQDAKAEQQQRKVARQDQPERKQKDRYKQIVHFLSTQPVGVTAFGFVDRAIPRCDVNQTGLCWQRLVIAGPVGARSGI